MTPDLPFAWPTSRRPSRSSRPPAAKSWASWTPASATWASSRTRTATCSSSTAATRRRRSVARAQLLERYRALPMPTTTDESWRFTDLAGFDPDAFAQNGHAPGARHRDNVGYRRGRIWPRSVPASRSSGARRHSLQAPRRVAPAARAARRLRREVRRPERGLLGARVARARPEGRRRGAAALRARREPAPGRCPLLAPAGDRRAREPVQPDRGARSPDPGLAGYSNAVVEPSSVRAPRSSTSRSRTSRARRGTSRRTGRGSSETPSWTGSPAASARRRAR